VLPTHLLHDALDLVLQQKKEHTLFFQKMAAILWQMQISKKGSKDLAS